MAPPTPTPAPNGTNATPEHRPPPALPPDPSEADIHDDGGIRDRAWARGRINVLWTKMRGSGVPAE